MMKKLFYLLVVLAFCTACSKDGKGGQGDAIKKATVKNAKLIYAGEFHTKADYGFMTVDEQGNVKPIRFITERGDTVNMYIYNVYNLSKEYLVLNGSFIFNGEELQNLLVNKNTELIYQMPYWLNEAYPTFEDENENIYFVVFNAVFRLNISNPNNMTLESYLPAGVGISDYLVDKNGVCYYDVPNDETLFFKCPGGRIYSFKELMKGYIDEELYEDWGVFLGNNGDLYLKYSSSKYDNSIQQYLRRNEIYAIKFINDNSLQAVKVASLPDENRDCFGSNDFCLNKTRNTCILSDGKNLFEFDETTYELKKFDISMPNTYRWNDYWITSESLWVLNENDDLYQLSLKDYTLKLIDLVDEGYKIYTETITCTPDTPGLSFSGFRYADGQNILGTINENGTITALENTQSSSMITTLIRLN